MNLVYLTNVRLPTEKAHGIQIMNMSAALAAAGKGFFGVKLVAPRRKNWLKADPFLYYGVSKSFSLVRLPCLDLLQFWSGPASFLIQELTFLLVAKIYSIFNKFEEVYSRDFLAALFFKNIFLELHVMPDRVTCLHRFLWRRSSHLFVLTNNLKLELEGVGIPAEKISVLADGVDLKKFGTLPKTDECRRLVGLPSDRPIIMYVGSLTLYDWKGVDIFLEAAKLCPKELFVLIGGSEQEVATLRKTAPDNALFYSRRPHSEIPNFLGAADVLVLPNKSGDPNSEKYTSPLKLFEYLAVGKPIIASDLPSIREVLSEQNSVLVAPSNATKLAAAIQEIMRDSKWREKIALAARQEANKYSWVGRAEKVLKVISLRKK